MAVVDVKVVISKAIASSRDSVSWGAARKTAREKKNKIKRPKEVGALR